MKVKELIAKLKKMPQNLEVYVSDHDHGTYEVNGKANFVTLVDQCDASEPYELGQIKHSMTEVKYVSIQV